MRKFYLIYKDREAQIVQSGIAQLPAFQNSGIVQSGIGQLTIDRKSWPFPLTWSRCQVLMRIKNEEERSFYELEATQNVWNVKSLKRQSLLWRRPRQNGENYGSVKV